MDIKYITFLFLLTVGVVILLYIRARKKSKDATVDASGDHEILEVLISRHDEDQTDVTMASLAAENMFSALHGLLHEAPKHQESISFEIVSSGTFGIKFYVVVPRNILKFVEGQIYAQFPTATIRVAEDYVDRSTTADSNYELANLKFTRPNFFALKAFRDFETDPLSSFTSAISNLGPSDEVWYQVVIRPIADIWQEDGLEYVNAVREGLDPEGTPGVLSSGLGTLKEEIITILGRIVTGAFSYYESEEGGFKQKSGSLVRLTPTQELEIRSIENKLARVGFEATIRIFSGSSDPNRVQTNLRSILASVRQYYASGSNTFTSEVERSREKALTKYKKRGIDEGSKILLSSEELATIYHFPSGNIDTPDISWSYSRKSEPPASLPLNDCVYIADTMFRSKKVRFGLSNKHNGGEDRLRHMYVIGKSGVGKSTLFESMISQDIVNGEGVCMLDPHGETIDKVLERIPDHRKEDVVYIDPSDTERPIGLNLLEVQDTSQKNLMASGLLAAIKHHFDYSWGPRLEYLLNYCLLTLIDVPGTTMLGITRLLEDKNYRNYILHWVKDPVVVRFWEKEYKEMMGNQRLVTEAIAPIQNKVNRFLASTTIRNILGQAKSTIDIWDIMQNRKILLINLSKGKIGADNADLLGALIVSRIQFYALQRSRIKDSERTPFYLYVDEFQNFSTGSFEEILSESRKYKLGLYLTHQFTAQLPEEILNSVLGNVGTIINFSSGATDAQLMEKEFMPYFTAGDIVTLERFYMYIRLMIDGMSSLPFSARILTPWEHSDFLPKKTQNKEEVLRLSREKYGVPKEYVEEKIYKWVNMIFDKGVAIAEEYKMKEKSSEIKLEKGETKL